MSIAALQGLNLGALSAALAAAGSLKNAGVTGYGVPTVGNSGSTVEASPTQQPVYVYSVAATALAVQEQVHAQSLAPEEAKPSVVAETLLAGYSLEDHAAVMDGRMGLDDSPMARMLKDMFVGKGETSASPDLSLASLGDVDSGLAGNGVQQRSKAPMHSVA